MTDMATNAEVAEVFRMSVRVFYEDTDATGVVYHANYLKYMERARTLWLAERGAGHGELAREHGVAFTLADASLVYRSPARLDDILDVSVAVLERRRVRIVFAQEIHGNGRLIVKARFTAACVRLPDFRPCALPAALYQEHR